jgi:hypothetical protein
MLPLKKLLRALNTCSARFLLLRGMLPLKPLSCRGKNRAHTTRW